MADFFTMIPFKRPIFNILVLFFIENEEDVRSSDMEVDIGK